MNRFLNIFLVVLLTIVTVNLFFAPQKQTEGLDIDFSSKNYTIPASVLVKVSNNTNESISINACENVEIRKNGEKLSFSEDFCLENENILVEAKTLKNIDYKAEYKNFSETGNYDLEVILGEKKFTSKTTIETKGAFSKIFTSLIYAPIYNLVVFLIEFFNNFFGWAVISVTIIIRLLLLWPQHRSMVSSRKLQELQPKIKKIQEDYKGNQQVIGTKIFELYKEEKVNPFGSCGFLFIQLPIIFVLYNIILGIQDPSNSYYLYSFIKDFDISSINYNFYGLDLLATGGIQGLILAIIIAGLQFLQIKYSLSVNPINKKETKDKIVLEKKSGANDYSQMMPDPELMNKFMLYVLPLVVGFATYSLFAGVGIYWGISTLFMLVQQIIVNKMLKKSS